MIVLSEISSAGFDFLDILCDLDSKFPYTSLLGRNLFFDKSTTVKSSFSYVGIYSYSDFSIFLAVLLQKLI